MATQVVSQEGLVRTKILNFLYDQVSQKKIPHIRPGMVEEFEEFIQKLLAEEEIHKMSDRMAQQAAETSKSEEVDNES